MAMGRQKQRQGEMLLQWDELPKSPGHVFYDRLQEVLIEAGFDAFVEGLCRAILRASHGCAVAAAGPLLPGCIWSATSRASG